MGKGTLFAYIFIVQLCLSLVALGFVSVWWKLEKKKRSVRFVLFACLLASYSLFETGLESCIAQTFIALIVTLILSFFYNLSEYLMLATGSYSVRTIYILLRKILASLGSNSYWSGGDLILILVELVTTLSIIIFVWNRKKYLQAYRISFACLISFSGIHSALLLLVMKKPILASVSALLAIGATVLVAYFGYKKTLSNESDCQVNF